MARMIAFREALREAMSEEMRRDDRVFLMGEEVAEYNGAYKVSQGICGKCLCRSLIHFSTSGVACVTESSQLVCQPMRISSTGSLEK